MTGRFRGRIALNTTRMNEFFGCKSLANVYHCTSRICQFLDSLSLRPSRQVQQSTDQNSQSVHNFVLAKTAKQVNKSTLEIKTRLIK